MKHSSIIIICLALSLNLWGQQQYRMGVLPTVNLNKKFSSKLKVNLKVQQRSIAGQGLLDDGIDFDWNYAFTDVASLAAYKLNARSTAAAGYQMRFFPSEIHHRFLQQYTIVQKYTRFRLAHRLAADETLEGDDGWQIRLRYRLAAEIPLNGQSLNRREWYLKINHEYLNIWQDAYNLEVRLVPILGYHFNEWSKIELGLEYRISQFLEYKRDRHTLFGILSWYYSF